MKIVYSMPAVMLCGGVVHHFFVIQRLAAKGHEISVYTPVALDLEKLPPIPENVPIIRHSRVDTNLFTLPAEKKPLQFLRAMWNLTGGLGSIASELPADADIVQAVFYPNVFAAEKMRQRTGSRCKILQSIHIDPEVFLPMSYRRYWRLWASAPKRADRLLTVCDSLKNSLEQRYGKPVHLVGNGVDEELLHGPAGEPAQVESLLSTGGRPYLLYVGSITSRKGIDTILHAFSRLRSEHPEYLLALAGKGHWEPYYASIARQEGMIDSVRVVPGVNREQLRHLLDHASCFLFPSRAEGFGLPPLEAMARGCPVVCTPCEGVDEYARDGQNCLQVRPENPEELAQAVSRLIEHPELVRNLSENAKRTAARFTWDRVAQLTEEAMIEAVGG